MNQWLKNKMHFISGMMLVSFSQFAFGADASHGQTLATTYCMGCHAHLPSESRSADQIANAIRSVGAMSGLQGLLGDSNALADIAAYAGGGASTTHTTQAPSSTPSTSSSPCVSDAATNPAPVRRKERRDKHRSREQEEDHHNSSHREDD